MISTLPNTAVSADPIFDLELILDLVEDFYAETDEEGEAKLVETVDEQHCLTVCRYDRANKARTFSVYVFPTSLLPLVDQTYRNTLRDNSSGSEFWDMWNSMISVLEFGHHITTEVFEV